LEFAGGNALMQQVRQHAIELLAQSVDLGE
jgi:hypothetical protein